MEDFNIEYSDRAASADRFRQLRIKLNKTQEEFAELLGLSVNSIKKIEKGENNISISNLRKLYKELEVSSDYLLYGKANSASDIWFMLQNTDDNVKLRILLRLVQYFGCGNSNRYEGTAENKEIFELIEKLLNQR